mmetsp:Transcript_1957/g.6478  ORF Transcript_1957/g.6478 Transcript_1957/m.6478 type:complete len:182 (+) Transcript_1957:56-601(+)
MAGRHLGIVLILASLLRADAWHRAPTRAPPYAACRARRVHPAVSVIGRSDFERYTQLREILDGTASDDDIHELVHALLGYRGSKPMVDEERARAWRAEFPEGPDLSDDATIAFAWLEAEIPDDVEQLDAMRVLFDTLYGEGATKQAIAARDPEFSRRSTIVTWVVLTTGYWAEIVSRRNGP